MLGKASYIRYYVILSKRWNKDRNNAMFKNVIISKELLDVYFITIRYMCLGIS